MKRIRLLSIFLICCFSVFFLQSCPVFSQANITVNPDNNLGLQVNEEILRTRNVLNNQTVQTYVSSLGQALARNSGRPDIPFNFIVIRDPNINAFASPGGYIYITTGMLNFLGTESELAAVLAHEIAHIVARHHVELALTELGLDLSFDYLGRLLNYNPQAVVPRLAQFIVLQRFSQREETQADEIGTIILARSGYSPYGMVRLLQSLQEIERRGFLSNFTASHPTSEDRVRHVDAYIRQNNLNQPGLIIDRPVFHQVKTQL
ncbi:MAG: hypothetical protein ACD_20C00357G0007 [uncultured bacterium]|nr:MAG: hypothetical protein ACD_20C00357G0007 [uncultured bacterium]HBH17361.1 hypothetical protein [Cyanobacteria bacterium UBA9579]